MIVRASKIAKDYGLHAVFKGLDFEISEGDRIAVIGENGSGKSTLFRILAGQTEPDSGALAVAHGAAVGYLPQEPRVEESQSLLALATAARPDLAALKERLRQVEHQLAQPELATDETRLEKTLQRYGTLQDEFADAGGYEFEPKVKSVLNGLGFDDEQLAQPATSLSGGEKKLAVLAQLLVSKPDLLLLDEPDNHLDLAGKAWLEEYILAHPGGVAIISHDRYFLDRFINHIFEIEDGKIHEYRCNYSGFRAAKQQRLEREAQLYAQHQREFEELRKSAEQLARWASLNNKFAGRAKNRKRMLEKRRAELAGKPQPVLQRPRLGLDFGDEARSGKIAVEFQGLSKRYGERVLFEPFDLAVRYGERIGLVGPNGSGKTTLFRILMQHEAPTSGTVRIGSQVKIGYYAQEQESLDPRQTPVEHLQSIRPMHQEQAVRYLTGKLRFAYQNAFSAIGDLSGGQKSRLQLASLALSGVNLLLLDEPTNNLDIPSMMVLEDALMEFEGTVLAISHDRYFLDQIVDRVIAIEHHRIEDFPGNFTDFYELKGGRIDIGLAAERRRPAHLAAQRQGA